MTTKTLGGQQNFVIFMQKTTDDDKLGQSTWGCTSYSCVERKMEKNAEVDIKYPQNA